eukprot:s1739_g3.t1
MVFRLQMFPKKMPSKLVITFDSDSVMECIKEETEEDQEWFSYIPKGYLKQQKKRPKVKPSRVFRPSKSNVNPYVVNLMLKKEAIVNPYVDFNPYVAGLWM